MNNRLSPFYKNIALWLLITLVMIFLFNYFNSVEHARGKATINYSKFIDLVKAHIPQNWQPKRELEDDEKMGDQDIAYEYLREHMYKEDKVLSREGIENLLVGLKILKNS